MRSDVSEVSVRPSLGARTQTKISHVSVGPVRSVPINRGWFTDQREHRVRLTQSLGVGFSRPTRVRSRSRADPTRPDPTRSREGKSSSSSWFLNIYSTIYSTILILFSHNEILAGAHASLGGSCRVTLVFVCSWTLPKDIFARERNVIRSRRDRGRARERRVK